MKDVRYDALGFVLYMSFIAPTVAASRLFSAYCSLFQYPKRNA